MRRFVVLVITAMVILGACSSDDDAAAEASETVVPAIETEPTAVPAAQIDDSEEDHSSVPFPPAQNEVEHSPSGSLVLGSPRSIFDLYDDIALVEDFTVYEDEQGRVFMTEAFVKEGLTYGYVAWTVDGAMQSTSSPASNELAMCAADVLAASMDRFDAELIARGVPRNGQSRTQAELFDLYIECGGTDELLTSFHDDFWLDPIPILAAECFETTVTTEEHLRIVIDAGGESFDEYLDLVAPCFNWSVVPIALEDTSFLCLQARNVDGLRSLATDDLSGLTAILESCLTPEEFAQLPS